MGKAEYRDKKTDTKTIPVHFTFVFTRDDANSDWLLINAFAVPRRESAQALAGASLR